MSRDGFGWFFIVRVVGFRVGGMKFIVRRGAESFWYSVRALVVISGRYCYCVMVVIRV